MKRTLTVLLMLMLITSLSAQRRSTSRARKAPEPVLPQMTVDEAMASYDFESAEILLNHEIEIRKKRKESTLEQEELLSWMHKAQMKLNAVEKVTFIDSIIVPRSEVLQHIQLSPECGTLTSYASFFQSPDTMDCTVFQSEMGDQIYYAQPEGNGSISLYSRSKYTDGSTSNPVLLAGLSDNSQQNYPFMMADGTTIYFASQGNESLGGYDIFMSRYDADERRFLAPENIGMPFNSPGNDYLYAVDEFSKLGWFVTDRNTTGDSVCIYTFIPNETRQVYVPEEMDKARLRQLARISSIRDTWTNEEALRAAQFRLRQANHAKQVQDGNDFNFIVTDNIVYHKKSDFRNDIALKLFESWSYAKSELQKTRKTLSTMRSNYYRATAAKRTEMKTDILTLEQNEEQWVKQIRQIEKDMRKAELGL